MVECGLVQCPSQHHVKPALRAFDADALTLHENERVQYHPVLALAAFYALLHLHLYLAGVARHIAFQPASAIFQLHRASHAWLEAGAAASWGARNAVTSLRQRTTQYVLDMC